MSAQQSYQNVINNLSVPHPNHYKNQRNLQQPPNQIRIPIPLELIKIQQPVEVTIKGKRYNGHISEKQQLSQPQINPATGELVLGKITIQYTDEQKQRKYFQMFSIQAHGSNHLRGDYHWHYVPNSVEDIALAQHNNSRNIQNPLQFSPHSTTTNIDEGTKHQFKQMLDGLKVAEKTVAESTLPQMDKSLLFELFEEHVSILQFQNSNASDIYNFVKAMTLINKVHKIQNESVIQRNKNSHQLLGNVQVITAQNEPQGNIPQILNVSHSNESQSNASQSNASQSNISHSNNSQSNASQSNASQSNISHSNNSQSNVLQSNLQPQNSTSNTKKHKCPFGNCDSAYTTRPSLNAHLLSHLNESNYAQVLPHECKLDNCDARFEKQKFLNQHINGSHSTKREKLEPEQKCPKCIVFKGTANAGIIMKGCYKSERGYTKVYCSCEAKNCGFTQSLKMIGHTYVYRQKKKKKKKKKKNGKPHG
eukprot:74365_1